MRGIRIFLTLALVVTCAQCASKVPKFPDFTSPAVFELENTVSASGLNETVAITEYFLASPHTTRLDFKEASGRTQHHLFVGNASEAYVWDSNDNCSVVSVRSDIREVQWGVFLSRLVFLQPAELERVVYENTKLMRGGEANKFTLSGLEIINGRFQSTLDVEYYFTTSAWKMPVRNDPALRAVLVKGRASIGTRTFTYEMDITVVFNAGRVTSLDACHDSSVSAHRRGIAREEAELESFVRFELDTPAVCCHDSRLGRRPT